MRRIRRIRAFIQRGHRGWADSDTWEMGWYLAGIIAGMAERLREHSWGYACVHEPADHQKHHEEGCDPKDWENILHRIEYGFRYYNFVEEYDWPESLEVYLQRSPEREKVQEEAVQEALRLLKKYWGHLWD